MPWFPVKQANVPGMVVGQQVLPRGHIDRFWTLTSLVPVAAVRLVRLVDDDDDATQT